ncbi:MAG: nucleotidyltransferase domain-containing protein [Gammaproteobacteria bacterium]|nr:nucleotidyltransferase domain-containing protein [Gammaproteobacteria bacterium]
MNKIINKLDEIQDEQKIAILFACEAGSRARGLESENSDYDVRFIYVHPRDWYLRVDLEAQRDVIEYPLDDKLDISGWDIRKALQLLYKSNPSIIEWLQSSIVYKKSNSFYEDVKTLLKKFYSPYSCFNHYLSMVYRNVKNLDKEKIVGAKNFINMIRPVLVLNWIEQSHQVPPNDLSTLAGQVISDQNLYYAIEQLVKSKKHNTEFNNPDNIRLLNNFVSTELDRLKKAVPPKQPTTRDKSELNQLFLDTVNSVS